jgi:hypothetical protein
MCDWKKIGIFAVVMTIIAQILRTGEAFATMSYYLDPNYWPVWSKIMMPGPGAPPAEFYYLSILFAFVTWVLFGIVYSILGDAIKEKAPRKKGLTFGGLMFLIGGLPGSMSMLLLFNLPFDLIIVWTVTSLVLYLMAGIIAVKLIKSK